MICKINCLVSIVFLVCMIWFNINTSKSYKKNKFINTLTSYQKQEYEKIINNRFTLAMQGYVLGFLLSLAIILYNYFIKKHKQSKISILCLVGCTTFLTQYFYYILSKKTNWMLEMNLTKESTQAWLEVYKSNQWQYHFGLLLGIIAVLFLSNAFNCKCK